MLTHLSIFPRVAPSPVLGKDFLQGSRGFLSSRLSGIGLKAPALARPQLARGLGQCGGAAAVAGRASM